MSWSEIKKVVNSDFTTPLNTRIDNQTNILANKFGFQRTLASTISLSPAAGATQTQTVTLSGKGIIRINSLTASTSNLTVTAKLGGIIFNSVGNYLFVNGDTLTLTVYNSYYGPQTGYVNYSVYTLGGAFRKCFENLIANILLKKGGVLV